MAPLLAISSMNFTQQGRLIVMIVDLDPCEARNHREEQPAATALKPSHPDAGDPWRRRLEGEPYGTT